MPDMSLIREKLVQIEESLNRSARRSSSITSTEDITASEHHLDKLDAIEFHLLGAETQPGPLVEACGSERRVIRPRRAAQLHYTSSGIC